MTEFLNNIWIAVSTPNQWLLNIISIPSMFIEIPLTLYLIINMFNLKNSKKQNLLYIGIMITVGIISTYCLNSPFNLIFNYVISFITIFIIFKPNILKTILATLLPSFIFIIIQTLNPYITILNITVDEFLTIAIYKIPITIITYVIVFTLTHIIKHKHMKLNLLENFDSKSKHLIIANLVFGLIYICIEIFITKKYIDILPITYTFSNFVMLLLYFFISLYCISEVIKLTNATTKLESAEEYNKTLHILHDNVRGFKHDFDNIVTTIGGYIKTDDLEGLKNYYIQLEKDCENVNNLYLLNPDSINNPGIYNLLTSKYHDATKKDINVNIYYLMDLNELHMKIYEFGRILGILLDNAIEAAENSPEKIINISFRREEKNHRNVIYIENSYSNKNVDTELIFNKGISEKENHSGIGLWEVRKIISKNSNVNLFTTKTDSMFKQQLEIYF